MILPPVEKRKTHYPYILDFGDGKNRRQREEIKKPGQLDSAAVSSFLGRRKPGGGEKIKKPGQLDSAALHLAVASRQIDLHSDMLIYASSIRMSECKSAWL
ncbi:MAG: hypothetical protein V8S96_09135 [Lachnospiraceae bacterium]